MLKSQSLSFLFFLEWRPETLRLFCHGKVQKSVKWTLIKYLSCFTFYGLQFSGLQGNEMLEITHFIAQTHFTFTFGWILSPLSQQKDEKVSNVEAGNSQIH